jgi:hypothetical protein
VDVIVEGHINSEEPMADVINSVVALKSCQTPVLRVNAADSDLQGRLLFSQGGYIVGGKVNVTGETGWDAVRILLNIKDGNYAILDPGRKATGDLNQALWIKVENILPRLGSLGANGDEFVDKQPQRNQESAVRPKTGQTDLAPLMAAVGAPKDEEAIDPTNPTRVKKEERQTVEAEAPSRKYNEGRWRIVRFALQLAFGIVAAGLIMWQSDVLWGWWWHHIWTKIMALFNIAV